MSGYCHNLFDSHVVSGYVKTPAGYEHICKEIVLEFLQSYGFKYSEFLYLEERSSHQVFIDGEAVADGVRFNVVFPYTEIIPEREIKQICKQLKGNLRTHKWIKGYISEDYHLIVKWGITHIAVGDNDYNEDY